MQWSEQALFILRNGPNKIEILKRLIAHFVPNSCGGSRAAVIESNIQLLDDLKEFEKDEIVKFIQDEKNRFIKYVTQERKFEEERDRLTDERFE